MMNVPSPNVDIVEGADVVEVDVGEGSGDREGDEKTDGRQKCAAFRPVGNVFVKKLANTRMAQHQERDARGNGHKEKKEPGFNGHVLLGTARRLGINAPR